MNVELASGVLSGLIFVAFVSVLYFKAKYKQWPNVRSPFYIKNDE